ncbi:unnamed protein product [Urochloa humidicola]
MTMIRRRFVNFVVMNLHATVYSLHRLDVSEHLFYPSTAEAVNKHDTAPPIYSMDPLTWIRGLKRLPPPCLSFRRPSCSPRTPWKWEPHLVALMGPRSSEGRILCCDSNGRSFLYDADINSVDTLPGIRGGLITGPMHPMEPIAISTGGAPEAAEEDLYILHGGGGFRVLRFRDRAGAWRWESNLPRPPFDSGAVRSHTVVGGGRTICVSSRPGGFGTYCFDTVGREWRRAGGWTLPFYGRVEYVPGLDLWLGLSAKWPYHPKKL